MLHTHGFKSIGTKQHNLWVFYYRDSQTLSQKDRKVRAMMCDFTTFTGSKGPLCQALPVSSFHQGPQSLQCQVFTSRPLKQNSPRCKIVSITQATEWIHCYCSRLLADSESFHDKAGALNGD